jgi:CRP-like cAMP-binding protein
MHEAFFNYLEKFNTTPLLAEEKALIRSIFIPCRLRKKQFLVQAGDVCKNFAFIVKGAMRMYTMDDNGYEHILRLGVENWWMGDRESYTRLIPSYYYVDAWEHCELLYISKEGADELTKKVPAFCDMKLQLDERNQIANYLRLTSAISDNAEKRYFDFIERYPEFLHRFPQHIIASYLGVNKDTLSRVKRQRHEQ